MTFSAAFSNLFTAIRELWSFFPVPLQVIILASFALGFIFALIRIVMSI